MKEAIEMRLGVHHHSLFHIDRNGDVFIVSFIGLWLDALSHYWKEVIYIGYSTAVRTPEQDYHISSSNKNIRFISAGEPGGIMTLGRRVSEMKKVINAAASDIEIIIVRSPTPRQATVLDAFSTQFKALYLVGESPKVPWMDCFRKKGLRGFLTEGLNERRRRQTLRLGRKNLVIANSIELREKYSALLGKEVFYAPSSSLQTEDFHLVEDRCQSVPVKLLFVGRVCEDKGVMDLIRAGSMVNSKGMKVLVSIVGGGPETDFFKKECKREGLENIVIWHGRIPFGPELFKIYRESDIFILPSRHEGFPHAILEAMANSVPVLVTKVGGIPAVCRNEQDVLYIDKTPENIADSVRRVAGDITLRKRLIGNGYKLAERFIVGENEKKLTEILIEDWNRS